MNDEEIEARAKALLGDISVRMLALHLDSMAYGATNDDKHTDGLVALIAAALRTARDEALEGAAKVADSYRGSPFPQVTETAEEIAKAIRSLSPKPAGGNDGK